MYAPPAVTATTTTTHNYLILKNIKKKQQNKKNKYLIPIRGIALVPCAAVVADSESRISHSLFLSAALPFGICNYQRLRPTMRVCSFFTFVSPLVYFVIVVVASFTWPLHTFRRYSIVVFALISVAITIYCRLFMFMCAPFVASCTKAVPCVVSRTRICILSFLLVYKRFMANWTCLFHLLFSVEPNCSLKFV